jgi:hypothetical protein
MDNRDFTRVKYAVGASISYGDEVVICTTDNLSLRGMYLRTRHEIPLDTPVRVTVYDSSLPSLKVNAQVVWREERGVGVQINNLNVDTFVQLRDIVTESSKDQDTVFQETYKMLKCIH